MTPPTPSAQAAAWYRANRPRIAAALPLTIGPATYLPSFCDRMDRWVTADLPPALAEAYICRPLRILREALKKAA